MRGLNAGTKVQIGAIITLAGDRLAEDSSAAPRRYARKDGTRFLSGPSRASVEILGQSLLKRTIAKLRELGTAQPDIIPDSPVSTALLPSRSAKATPFIAAWESAVANQVGLGVELILLLRIGSYFDLDYDELLRFHLQERSRLTQVYGPSGALDVALVDATLFRGADGPYRKIIATLIPEQHRFFYRGYVNPLNKAQDYRRLVEDGLYGRCGLRPVGKEVAPGVWHGTGAQVDSSSRISAPAFIGAGSRIAECCVVSGASTIERDCEIDCGTLVDQSCILQGTYVGVALDVRHSIVDNQTLFHLERNVEIGFADKRLIGRAKAVALKTPAESGFHGVSSS